MKKPLWIVFEGIDGSGKTTQASKLCSHLNNIGISALYKHVFDTNSGKLIKNIFLDNDFLGNTVEVLLLCAARKAFLDDMKNITTQFDVIVVDRFYLSILAMQGITPKDIALIQYVRSSIGDLPESAYYVYIDADPRECRKRFLLRDRPKDRIERLDLEFHSKVRERYISFLTYEKNVIYINGNNDINTVHDEIVRAVMNLLGNR